MENPIAHFQVYAQSAGTTATEVVESSGQSGSPVLRLVSNYVLVGFIVVFVLAVMFIGWKWYRRKKRLQANPTHKKYSKASLPPQM